jgi:hypothetical protein
MACGEYHELLTDDTVISPNKWDEARDESERDD